jgi:hypothetical protein
MCSVSLTFEICVLSVYLDMILELLDLSDLFPLLVCVRCFYHPLPHMFCLSFDFGLSIQLR